MTHASMRRDWIPRMDQQNGAQPEAEPIPGNAYAGTYTSTVTLAAATGP